MLLKILFLFLFFLLPLLSLTLYIRTHWRIRFSAIVRNLNAQKTSSLWPKKKKKQKIISIYKEIYIVNTVHRVLKRKMQCNQICNVKNERKSKRAEWVEWSKEMQISLRLMTFCGCIFPLVVCCAVLILFFVVVVLLIEFAVILHSSRNKQCRTKIIPRATHFCVFIAAANYFRIHNLMTNTNWHASNVQFQIRTNIQILCANFDRKFLQPTRRM